MAVSFAESVYDTQSQHSVRSAAITSLFDGARGRVFAANDSKYFDDDHHNNVHAKEGTHGEQTDADDLALVAGQTSDHDRAVNLARDGDVNAVLDIIQLKIEQTDPSDARAVEALENLVDSVVEALDVDDGSLDYLFRLLSGGSVEGQPQAEWHLDHDAPEEIAAGLERSRALYEKLDQLRISAATHEPQGYQPADAAPAPKSHSAPSYAVLAPSPSF